MKEIIEMLEKFIDERDWKRFHTPKNLSISIAIEAAELMEHFQWDNPNFNEIGEKEEITDEIADIMIYCIMFLNYMGKDITKAIIDKIHKNSRKYPL